MIFHVRSEQVVKAVVQVWKNDGNELQQDFAIGSGFASAKVRSMS